MLKWFGLISILLLFSFKKPTQGIAGVVLWKAGNLMPSPDAKTPKAKGLPVQREVYVYALTPESQTEKDGEGFYQKIKTKFIKKTKTDAKGHFWVRLPVGYYSLFVKEEKGFFANAFDDAMNINPVQVERRKWTKTALVVDYQAVY